MAIFFPDILENNNTNYPLVDATSLKGTAYPLASINNTGSIPSDKRNVGTIVFDSGSGKFYGFKGSSVSNWNTGSNWIEFGSGSGGGTTVNHLFDRCIVNGFTSDGYNAGILNLQFVPTGSTLNGLFGENLAYKVGDKMIVYVDDKNYIKGTVNQVPGGFGVGSINVLVNAVIGTTASDDYCITLDLTRDSYVYATQTGSFLYSGSYNSTTSALTLHSSTNTYNLDLSGLAGGGGGGFAITASNEGTVLTENARTFDFVGNAVTATNVGSAVTVTINTGSGATTNTGSLMVTGSVSNATVTFTKGDGSTFPLTINNVNNAVSASFATTASYVLNAVSASFAPNIYNSDGTVSANRTATIPASTFLKFRGTGAGSVFQVDLASGANALITGLPTGISSSLVSVDLSNGQLIAMTTSSIQNVVSSSYALTASFATATLSASFAPNIYNSDGTLTAAREVNLSTNALKFNNSSAFFTVSGSDRVTFNNLNEVNTGYVAGYDLNGILGNQGMLGYVTASKLTVASASHAPNLYNSNGTLTGDRVITLGANNELRIQPSTGASEFRVSDGPKGGPFSYEFAVSSSGEIRVNSSTSASFATDIFVTSGKVLTLQPASVLPIGAPVGSFAVSSSVPPRPYMWDGTTWYAL